MVSLSTGSRTVRAQRRWSARIRPGPESALRCWTRAIAAEKPAGRSARMRSIAVSPPSEVPITTISYRIVLVLVLVLVVELHGRGRGRGRLAYPAVELDPRLQLLIILLARRELDRLF